MKSILVIVAAFVFMSCEQSNWEKDNPTCATACDWVETCVDTRTQDFWVCDENQCSEDTIASTPVNDPSMAPVACALADFVQCADFITCLGDLD